jgi:hypothetical protein
MILHRTFWPVHAVSSGDLGQKKNYCTFLNTRQSYRKGTEIWCSYVRFVLRWSWILIRLFVSCSGCWTYRHYFKKVGGRGQRQALCYSKHAPQKEFDYERDCVGVGDIGTRSFAVWNGTVPTNSRFCVVQPANSPRSDSYPASYMARVKVELSLCLIMQYSMKT